MAPLHRRTVLVAILALAAVVATAGCEQPPDDAALTDGLLVLSGDVGSVRLTVREDGGERGRRIKLPDPGTSWVSAGRSNVLLATLVDGSTYVSDPLDEEDPSWRLVEPVTLTDQPPTSPLFYGSWDPPGRAYAQLGADFTEDGGMRAVVVDPALDQAVEVAIDDRRALPAPPAWIDDDRLVLVSATADGTEAVIVDSASRESRRGPGGVQLLTTSADARITAVWEGPGSSIEVMSTEAWLAEEPGSARVDPPDDAALPAVLALDGSGERLAVVWTDEDGTPTSITVHAVARDWARVSRLDPGEASAATVAWLR